MKGEKKLAQVHVVVCGKTSHFSDLESAIRFLWFRSIALVAVRETVQVLDGITDAILN